MKRFIFDSILDEENICNLEKEKHKIMKGVDNGLKLLVYGKRNTGKTSLIKNVIAKSWLQRQSSGFSMYVDLMGVRQLSQISERMTIAFSEAYNACFKMKSVFNNMLKIIRGIKPSIELDEKGNLKLSFGIVEGQKIRPFTAILKQLDLIYASNREPLSVVDLCRTAAVSRRTLEYAFQERFGLSPKAYMLARRLGEVRAELRLDHAGQSITRIANQWGFHHLSRFAARYRRQFGELPSQTMWAGDPSR